MTSQPATPSDAAATSPGASPMPPRRRRARRWIVGVAIAALAYAVLGFLVAPRILRRAIEEQGTAALHRAVTVAEVRVNPFTLAVTVRGLVVKDLDAPQLAGWESLYVRLAPWKVLRGDLGVAEIRLTRPFGRIALDRAGRLNVRDLLAPEAAAAPAPGPPPSRSRLGVALDRLEIEEARLVFEDASRSAAFETTLGPVTIRLTDFRTRGGADSPYAFTGTTEAGETFSWSGTVLSDPLRSSGTISFAGVKLPKYDPYTREQAPGLLVESGTFALDARYHLEWGAAARRLSLSGLRAVVEDLALARRRDRARALELPRLEVSGGEVDLVARVASVAEVKVLGARLRPRREADGKIALLEMLERPVPAPAGKGESAPPAEGPAWSWSVQAIAVERASVEAEDLVPPRPVRVALPEVSLRLSGLTGRPDARCALSGSLRWGGEGKASFGGTVSPFAAKAELEAKAERIDLAPLAPYLDDAAPVRLAAAWLGLSARTAVDAGAAAAAWTFAGDVRIDGLSLRHPSRDEELLRWRSLEVRGIDAASAKARASVKAVTVTEPVARALVLEDGTSGLSGARPAPGAAPARPPPTPAAGPAWRTSVGLFQVVRGRATFTDRSVRPPVLLSLADVEARVTGLSSDPSVRSAVDVRARVDGVAPVTVKGTVNPLQAVAYTDLAVAAKGIDLTPLDPYAGKHLGYGLRKGKLDLDLAYQVQDRALRAANVVRVDQLTLGEATNSPDATGLPVRLALALLTDRDGVILLDVPVEGRTDDPEFRLGRVIWRTVLNVLVKVAASPFSALASLVGGGKEDISLVEFAPGSARLDEQGRRRIELLARSLAQRPALSLELEPAVDARADPLALQRAELERQLRRAKAARMRPPPAADAIAALEIAADERPRLVEALLAATSPPAPSGAGAPAAGGPAAAPAAVVTTGAAAPAGTAPAATAAEQEARLVEAMPLEPEALPSLLAARHAAAREALVAAGLDPARIFAVQGGERAARQPGPRVHFSVR